MGTPFDLVLSQSPGRSPSFLGIFIGDKGGVGDKVTSESCKILVFVAVEILSDFKIKVTALDTQDWTFLIITESLPGPPWAFCTCNAIYQNRLKTAFLLWCSKYNFFPIKLFQFSKTFFFCNSTLISRFPLPQGNRNNKGTASKQVLKNTSS